jgi:hypothetical protein
MEDPIESARVRKALKSLADIIYILNKVYLLNTDKVIFIVFDDAHISEIEQYLSQFGLTLRDIISTYDDKRIKVVRIYPIHFDKDINFFVSNVVPIEALTTPDTDFFKGLEVYLEAKSDYDRLSYLKYSMRKEKYSKLIERKFPRARSAIETSILALIIIELSLAVLLHRGLEWYTILSIALEGTVFVDGVLGFIEFRSSKRINTAFYDKIHQWHEEHLDKLKKMPSETD